MKRLCLPLLLVCCLLLSACGSHAAEDRYSSFAQALSETDTLSFTAVLRAEYEDKTVDFTLRYDADTEGAVVTVLAPELVAGIKARVSGGSTALEYEGIIIDTGRLDDYGLTPMSALPTLVEAMRGGHLESYWTEDNRAVFQLILDDHLYAVVYFESETMTPVRAELVSDGSVRVVCDIAGWGGAADTAVPNTTVPDTAEGTAE